MKNAILIIGLWACAFICQAQQDAQYSQFMFNKMYFNPAYAGTKSHLCMSAIYRKQWLGIKRAPQTATFNIDGGVWNNRLGLGMSISYDQIGFSDRLSVETNYAYIIRFKNESFLSLGLRGSIHYTQIRWDEAELLEDFDDAIPLQTGQEVLPNFGAGVYYQAKKWYLGFSVPHIFRNRGSIGGNYVGGVEPKFTQHYYLMGGFMFKLAKNIQIQQNLLMKYVVGAPLGIDINLSFVFYEKILVGVTYRVGSSIDALVQWQITPQLRIAAAYDFSITELQRYNSGSIEAMVSYCFVKQGDKRAIFNERFF